MSEHWDAYTRLVENQLVLFVLDMGVPDEVSTLDYPYAFQIIVPLRNPTEQGLGSEEEMDKLNELMERMYEYLYARSIFPVGRIISKGKIDFYFYHSAPNLEPFEEAVRTFWTANQYEAAVLQVEEDEPWSAYYDVLYPNNYENHRMGNRDFVEVLEEQGDSLHEPRLIDHLFLFETKQQRNGFIEEMIREGFQLTKKSLFKKDGLYELILSRKDSVELGVIDDLTDFLIDAAEKHKGDYDGWHTFVVPSSPE